MAPPPAVDTTSGGCSPTHPTRVETRARCSRERGSREPHEVPGESQVDSMRRSARGVEARPDAQTDDVHVSTRGCRTRRAPPGPPCSRRRGCRAEVPRRREGAAAPCPEADGMVAARHDERRSRWRRAASSTAQRPADVHLREVGQGASPAKPARWTRASAPSQTESSTFGSVTEPWKTSTGSFAAASGGRTTSQPGRRRQLTHRRPQVGSEPPAGAGDDEGPGPAHRASGSTVVPAWARKSKSQPRSAWPTCSL